MVANSQVLQAKAALHNADEQGHAMITSSPRDSSNACTDSHCLRETLLNRWLLVLQAYAASTKVQTALTFLNPPA